MYLYGQLSFFFFISEVKKRVQINGLYMVKDGIFLEMKVLSKIWMLLIKDLWFYDQASLDL